MGWTSTRRIISNLPNTRQLASLSKTRHWQGSQEPGEVRENLSDKVTPTRHGLGVNSATNQKNGNLPYTRRRQGSQEPAEVQGNLADNGVPTRHGLDVNSPSKQRLTRES